MSKRVGVTRRSRTLRPVTTPSNDTPSPEPKDRSQRIDPHVRHGSRPGGHERLMRFIHNRHKDRDEEGAADVTGLPWGERPSKRPGPSSSPPRAPPACSPSARNPQPSEAHAEARPRSTPAAGSARLVSGWTWRHTCSQCVRATNPTGAATSRLSRQRPPLTGGQPGQRVSSGSAENSPL